MEFIELAQKISPKLNAIAHKLNGRFTFFNEEDLYQEALLHLWREYEKGSISDKTESFVIQGCYFFLKNHIRKVYKRIDKNSIALDVLNTKHDGKSSIEDSIFLEDKKSEINHINANLLLEEICAHLSEREKIVLSLSLEGLTVREIGNRLNVSHVMIIKIEKRIRDKCSKFKKELLQ